MALEQHRRPLARFWREHLSRERGRILWAGLAMVGLAAGNAALPPVIAWAVDRLNPQEAPLLYWAPVVVIPVIALKAVCGYLGSGLIEGAAQNVILDMRRQLFSSIMASDLARLAQDRSGDLASRFVSDMSVLREAVARTVRNLAADLFSVIGLIGAMLYLNAALTLVVFTVLALGGWPILAIGKRLRRISADVQGRFGRMTAFLAENFAAARLIKTYRLEDRQAGAADEAFTALRDRQMRAAWSKAKVEPIMELLGALAVCGVLALAAWFVERGRADIGDFAGFIAAVLLAAQHARRVGTLHVAVQEGAAALERLFAAMDEPARIVDGPGARPLPRPSGVIAFEGVGFAYGDEPTLTDVSFDVAAGETVALVGASGAGKSTVFNLLARLYDAGRGAVRVDGIDVREVRLADLRDAIALVAQDVTLLDDTIGANIAFGRLDAGHAEIETAARAACAHDFIMATPDGYDARVGERGLNLSGGQRQRIALARAILRDASILLLDEATSALDAESEHAVRHALETARRGRTMLIIAHRLATVRAADRILVFDRGRLVETGRHGELMARRGIYARLAGVELAA